MIQARKLFRGHFYDKWPWKWSLRSVQPRKTYKHISAKSAVVNSIDCNVQHVQKI